MLIRFRKPEVVTKSKTLVSKSSARRTEQNFIRKNYALAACLQMKTGANSKLFGLEFLSSPEIVYFQKLVLLFRVIGEI